MIPNVRKKAWRLDPTKDTDRDGTPDIGDCQPYNPKKQGILHGTKPLATMRTRILQRQLKGAKLHAETRKEGLGRQREQAKLQKAIHAERAKYRPPLKGKKDYVGMAKKAGKVGMRAIKGGAKVLKGMSDFAMQLSPPKKKKKKQDIFDSGIRW